MTDFPIDDAFAPDTGEPVRELEKLREEPSDRFLLNVLDGINARQTSTQALEMSWWGMTGLLTEFIDTLFRTLGLREDRPEDSEK